LDKTRLRFIKKEADRVLFECKYFPCAHLKKINQRHPGDYNVSLVDKALRIKKNGAGQWLRELEAEWRCPKFGGYICVMDKECYGCEYKIE